MKTSHDPRHQHRIALVKSLFAYDFQQNPDDDIADIVAKLPEIDAKIHEVAKEHPIASMNKIDLAMLRVGVFELMGGEVKPAIIIDEAVEIAKEYGGDNSSKFIHAVLNALTKQVPPVNSG